MVTIYGRDLKPKHPCMQLLVGSLIQVLLVDMSYLSYLWSQCFPSELKYSGLLSFLVKSNAVLSTYTLVWWNYCYSNVFISVKQAQALQFVRENVYRNLLDAST